MLKNLTQHRIAISVRKRRIPEDKSNENYFYMNPEFSEALTYDSRNDPS